MNIFSVKYLNAGFQKELAFARGFAVLFMVLVHVKEDLPGYPFSDMYANIIEFCGSPLAAPTFMLLLGAGIVYSKNREPKKLAMRGLQLFAANYVLNFVAFGIPHLIVFAQTKDVALIETILDTVFGVDILAFAGLAFLFFALTEKLKLKLIHIALISLVLSCLNYILTDVAATLNLSEPPGWLVRAEEYSYFPFLSWIEYPVMGYVFGHFLKRCSDKKAFYKYLLSFSALIVVALSLGALKYDFDLWSMHFGPETYYYQDFLQYILVGGICFSWLSILYFLTSATTFKAIDKHFERWSKNTTAIFFIQWLIIGWFSILNFIEFPVNPYVNLATGLTIFILSDIIAVFYKRIIQKRKGV
ncbi:MAG: DUF1624 domain-containing protein [Oscillospiraceae bacterium]|nr:DUF1624 domain-containing protein [Oscillospiraceae bacterium]